MASDAIGGLSQEFERAFETPPEVIGRAPGRVNLIGEHTDYNNGLVLPLALPHATYAAVSRRPDDLLQIASRQQRNGWSGPTTAIGPGHRLAGEFSWANYVTGVVWALREAGHDLPGLDIYIDGQVPLGAGLSSSAALECSVAVALANLLGLDLDESTRKALIAACIRAETEVAGAPTGGMDQTVSMLGRAGTALLIDFDAHTHRAVPLDPEAAGLTLLVTDTRVSHALVDGGYAARRDDCIAAAAALGVPSLRQATLDQVASLDRATLDQIGSSGVEERVLRRARHVVTEIARVADCVTALEATDWPAVGRLFAASHASMRDDFEISCPELDLVVETAVSAGALGSRMTGGGFGGSAVSIVPTARLSEIEATISAAFTKAGYRAPHHIRVAPSMGAELVD